MFGGHRCGRGGGLNSQASNNDIINAKIFGQEQIARTADLGLGALSPAEVDLIPADDASREYRDRIVEILNKG